MSILRSMIFVLFTLTLIVWTPAMSRPSMNVWAQTSGSHSDDDTRSAIRDPEITIIFRSDSFKAVVEPGSDRTAVVMCEARCVMPPETASLQYVILELDAYCEGWDTYTPVTLYFDKETEVQLFNFSVIVDPQQKAGDYNLSLTGTWFYSPGTSGGMVGPFYGTVQVLPFGYINLGSKYYNVTANVGDWVGKSITIRSNGNSDCKVVLSLEDVPSNVEVYLSQETLEFSSFGQNTLEIRLIQDGGSGSSHSIMLKGKNSVPGIGSDFVLLINFHTKVEVVSSDMVTGAVVGILFLAVFMIITLVIVVLIKMIRRNPK